MGASGLSVLGDLREPACGVGRRDRLCSLSANVLRLPKDAPLFWRGILNYPGPWGPRLRWFALKPLAYFEIPQPMR